MIICFRETTVNDYANLKKVTKRQKKYKLG